MQSRFRLLWTTRRSLKAAHLDAVMESLLDQILWMFTFSFTFSFSIKTIHSFAMSSFCQNCWWGPILSLFIFFVNKDFAEFCLRHHLNLEIHLFLSNMSPELSFCMKTSGSPPGKCPSLLMLRKEHNFTFT